MTENNQHSNKRRLTNPKQETKAITTDDMLLEKKNLKIKQEGDDHRMSMSIMAKFLKEEKRRLAVEKRRQRKNLLKRNVSLRYISSPRFLISVSPPHFPNLVNPPHFLLLFSFYIYLTLSLHYQFTTLALSIWR